MKWFLGPWWQLLSLKKKLKRSKQLENRMGLAGVKKFVCGEGEEEWEDGVGEEMKKLHYIHVSNCQRIKISFLPLLVIYGIIRNTDYTPSVNSCLSPVAFFKK